jgi:phosphoglycerate dehydrogenase-like enzyme
MLYTDAEEFPLTPDLLAQARAANLELRFVDGHDFADLAREGESCAGMFLFFGYVTDELLEQLPHCRLLVRVGTGYDRIDVQAAIRRDVTVTYVPDFSTEELSNQVLMFILAFSRRLPFLIAQGRRHRWPGVAEFPMPNRLSAQSLGILGFGRSGQAAAMKARAFGLKVRAWSRTPRPQLMRQIGVDEVSFEEALASDYVSIHLPLTEQTFGLIDDRALSYFKPDGVLINISRGGIVSTEALMDALRSGRLAGAGLDVVDPDPLPSDHPLWEMPNVIITSHTAALSRQAQITALATAFADAAAVLAGLEPENPVPEMATKK